MMKARTITRLRAWASLAAYVLFSCVVLNRLEAATPERTLLATPPRAIADFELTNHEGRPFRLSQLKGAPALIFFGFSHCPAICPAALQELKLLEQQHRADLGPTRIVIVSVDGERDTPAAMKAWLAPVSKSFIGLTGPSAKIRPIAEQFSAAFYKAQGKTPQEYLVEHNSQIFLLDAKGELRATFFHAPVKVMAEVTRSMRTPP